MEKDEQIVTKIQTTQNQSDFEILYLRYFDLVYKKCLNLTRDSPKAQDFTQDIFLIVLNKLNTFQHKSTFSTWLYAISHNYCMERLRVTGRLKTESLEDGLLSRIAEPETESVELQLHQLYCLLNQLPEQQATFLKLKYVEGLSIRELADRYQLADSAVKMRLTRSRKRLRELYFKHFA